MSDIRPDEEPDRPVTDAAVWRAGTARVVAVDHPGEIEGHEIYGPESAEVAPVDDGGPERVTRGRPAGDDAGLYTDEDRTPR